MKAFSLAAQFLKPRQSWAYALEAKRCLAGLILVILAFCTTRVQAASVEDGTKLSEFSLSFSNLDCPTLLKVWPAKEGVMVSDLCHGLLFYGLGPTDLPSFPTGESMLKVLTDESAAVQNLGGSPFVRTRNGLRYFLANDPVYHARLGEAHRDQCLATFAILNLPLSTPIKLKDRSYSISNLLSESVANFSFDQSEPAWTTIAYSVYLTSPRSA